MAIKVQYKGYDLEFSRVPTAEQIVAAYEEVRAKVGQKLGGGGYQPIRRVPRDQELPLSFAQEWFWLLDQTSPGNPAYNLSTGVRIKGQLNVAALKEALDALTERHEVLRATFPEVNGQPRQVIAPRRPAQLSVIDLGLCGDGRAEAMLPGILAAAMSWPFRLAEGPLSRAALVRLGERDHAFCLFAHHIVSDAWSTGILVRELVSLYQARLEGRPDGLPPLPVQYADFACWQRQMLQGEKLDALLAYWRRQLAAAPAVLQLPLDRPRPPVQTFAGARETIELPAALSDALKRLARAEGVSLYVVLLAAFQVLLYRYSRQDDVIVGSPMAGRNRAEVEGVVGCFINTLPLRVNLGGNPRFRELIKQVREVTQGAQEHQELPFEKVVAALRPERNLSHTPFFQVLFDFLNLPPMSQTGLRGLEVYPLGGGSSVVKIDLLLCLWEGAGGLTGYLDYKIDLFDRATIRRMVAHLGTLLSGVAEAPDTPLDALDMLSDEEKQLRLEEERANREKLLRARPKAIRLA